MTPARVVRTDYRELARIASSFGLHSSETQQLLNGLTRQLEVLRQGDWVGRGAKAFYREMDSEVLPSLKRLAGALERAQRITLDIHSVMKQAEEEAARLFRLTAEVGALGAGSSYVAVAGADGQIPDWVRDFVLAVIPFGDSVDILKQLMNRLRGQQVDELVLTLAVLGMAADLGWLNPIPSAEDAPNVALAALKALAKQIPPGAARESLQEMVELATKNADEARRLGEVLVALTKNSDLAIALTKNPDALVAVMRHGPEAVELLGRFTDDAVTLVGKYGEEGIRILNRAETAAANAYDVAKAGGTYAGSLREYASKSTSELRKAAASHEKQVAIHIRKLSDPASHAENWLTETDLYRQGLLRKWENDLVRNREMAEIMRRMVRERNP